MGVMKFHRARAQHRGARAQHRGARDRRPEHGSLDSIASTSTVSLSTSTVFTAEH
jgi:hypothetical protein